jgi:membrane carboxypeptidase/penicillin-binding protein
VASSRGALPIWRRFAREATGGRIRGAFPRPASVVALDIDPASGALAGEDCPRRRSELFLRGTAPKEVCPGGTVAERRAEPEAGGSYLDWLRRRR